MRSVLGFLSGVFAFHWGDAAENNWGEVEKFYGIRIGKNATSNGVFIGFTYGNFTV